MIWRIRTNKNNLKNRSPVPIKKKFFNDILIDTNKLQNIIDINENSGMNHIFDNTCNECT